MLNVKLRDNNLQANGSTALIMSSDQGHEVVVKLLLATGAKVDKAASNGATPLIVSIHQGHKDPLFFKVGMLSAFDGCPKS